MSKILVVDDEMSIVEVLRTLLTREGYTVVTASDGGEALTHLREEAFDLMISDVRMAPIDGITLLHDAKEIQSHLAVIMMTAYGTVETAVEAMKAGAFDYITKPFKIDELILTVTRALNYEHVLEKNEQLRTALRTKYHFDNLIGDSDAMQKVYKIIEKVARTDTNVLIRGDSGTGKELVAKALHFASPRIDEPFIPINCAALPESLLESELFGYVKGAFTGANKFKKGLFESAHAGTVFLDEVGSIPINMQLKLLRVIQEREIMHVGGTKPIPIDVRIIAATNENLEEKIKEGQFREDLFFRLNVVPIELPPLKDRLTDIPLLINHFIRIFSSRKNNPTVTIEKEAIQNLNLYDWPGNVRELENAINRAAIMCEKNIITYQDLPPQIKEHICEKTEKANPNTAETTLKTFLHEKEQQHIRNMLKQYNGDKNKTAEKLGIKPEKLEEFTDEK
ncbi:MAG: sigma-54 dependent transcriptional regulator [Verrucomicrobiota bacterium]|nr:sigma-54 dependent transcriptional regulator [Verrucomicrobiota bacterium]